MGMSFLKTMKFGELDNVKKPKTQYPSETSQ